MPLVVAAAAVVAVVAGAAARVTTSRGPRHPPRPPPKREQASGTGPDDTADDADSESVSSRRRRRRRRGAGSGDGEGEDPPGTVTRVREPRSQRDRSDEPTAVKGSTRLEAKRQRRREGRDAGRRRTIITEAEFLARRESVERVMVVREPGRPHPDRRPRGRRARRALRLARGAPRRWPATSTSAASRTSCRRMEAAFVDIGKGRNAVLYAGEVNWDAAGLEGGQARRIEHAMKSGDTVLVQVTKDPIGHKGARLTSQITLAGPLPRLRARRRMTGISRKLPDTERARLKKPSSRRSCPTDAGVIVRTAAEGASEEELRADVERLTRSGHDQGQGDPEPRRPAAAAPPPCCTASPTWPIRVVRDVFNEDFTSLVVSGRGGLVRGQPVRRATSPPTSRRACSAGRPRPTCSPTHRIDEQLAKGDGPQGLAALGRLARHRPHRGDDRRRRQHRQVHRLGRQRSRRRSPTTTSRRPRRSSASCGCATSAASSSSTSSTWSSSPTATSSLRRLIECLGRDRTKHQVAEVTSLGLVQMTRKRVGQGLVEVFSEPCEHCYGSRLRRALRADRPWRLRTTRAGPTLLRRDRVEAAGGRLLPVAPDQVVRMPGRPPRRSARPRARPRPRSRQPPHAAALRRTRLRTRLSSTSRRRRSEPCPRRDVEAAASAVRPPRCDARSGTHERRARARGRGARGRPSRSRRALGAGAEPGSRARARARARQAWRRKRGRVVAPAGPPRGASAEAERTA